MSVLLSGSNYQNQSFRFEITDPSQIGEARRFATQLAQVADFDEVSAGRVSIILTELATNLLKHAQKGELILQLNCQSSHVGFEVIGIDRGPGLSDVSLCFQDGYSTASTSGTGLGAVRRQSDRCDIYTSDKGTVVFSTVYKNHIKPADHGFYIGGICLPVHGEMVCGDGWSTRDEEDTKIILVADGLGHGLLAHDASLAATESLKKTSHPKELNLFMQEVHLRLRSTRGAAVAVGRLNLAHNDFQYLSIGNIRAVIVQSDDGKNLISHAGTLGLQYRKMLPVSAAVPKEARLVFYSDGLSQRWDLRTYPGLAQRHPAVIAAVLYRDFSRGTDDVTTLAGGWIS